LGGPPVITSRQNATVKRARALARGRDVSEAAALCVEGVRLFEDALAQGVRFEAVLVASRLDATERGAALHERLWRSDAPVLDATDAVLESISDVAGNQGVVGLAYKKTWERADLFPSDRAPLVIVAWGVQDPGNLGTIIRTADASGATGLLATPATACPYNTKCIRATAGSIFRLPLMEVDEDSQALEMLRAQGVVMIGTALAGGARHVDADFTKPVAIVLGGEGGGLPEHVVELCDQSVRIPIRPGVESLNVASAAAIILYEAARQRNFKGLV